jgi:hypothetical protein
MRSQNPGIILREARIEELESERDRLRKALLYAAKSWEEPFEFAEFVRLCGEAGLPFIRGHLQVSPTWEQ